MHVRGRDEPIDYKSDFRLIHKQEDNPVATARGTDTDMMALQNRLPQCRQDQFAGQFDGDVALIQ